MSLDLDERRIEVMHDRILDAIELDSRRRGKRARRVVGAGLAVCLVVIAGLAGVRHLASTLDSGVTQTSMSSEAASDSAGATTLRSSGGRIVTGEQVVITGSVKVVVDDVDGSTEALVDWAKRHGGRVDYRSRAGTGDTAQATVVLRVPNDEVDAVVREVGRHGTLGRVSIDRHDVAMERRDLEARIDSLSVSVKRLRTIMAEATRSSDLLAAEQALSERQAELESLRAQRTRIDDSVDLASVRVHLDDEGRSRASGDGFRGALGDGWHALVSAAGTAIVVIGFLIPWLALGAVAVGAVLLLRRRRR